MKNLCHCQDNCSWREGDGQSSIVLTGLDRWSWHSGRCDAELIGGKNIVSVPHHDGLLLDMVNDSIEEDSNITCDEDSNTTCDDDLNTTCDRDSNTTCDEGFKYNMWWGFEYNMWRGFKYNMWRGFQIQHVTRIRIQHVTRTQIQHVTRIRILHVKRIDLLQRRTRVKDDWGTEVYINLSRPRMPMSWRRRNTHMNKLWRFF